MAGLVPAIHAVVARADAGRLGLHHDQQAHGILYTGVTSDIGRRANEHHEGLVKGFTKRYGLKRLVYMEFYDTVAAAIQRESNMKHWPRARKAQLIVNSNPGWLDLFETLNQ
jgi:putative endonuclease